MKYLKLFEEHFNKSKILFLHGLDSKPFEDRTNIMEASGAIVISPHINYRNGDSSKIAENIIEEENITHLAGHSMGGILSYYLSNKYKLPVLMFNPAFRDHDSEFFGDIKYLKKFDPYTEQFAVVGMKDDVILPKKQLENLKHATVWKVENLGHRIDPTTFKKYFEIFCEKTNIK